MDENLKNLCVGIIIGGSKTLTAPGHILQKMGVFEFSLYENIKNSSKKFGDINDRSINYNIGLGLGDIYGLGLGIIGLGLPFVYFLKEEYSFNKKISKMSELEKRIVLEKISCSK